MSTAFYRESNGDYLCIDVRLCSEDVTGQRFFDGRAAAVEGLPTSVCTCSVGVRFLKESCRRVRRKDVPQEWLQAMGV
jgi:hypothetical protein